jgi:hypothetical protein
MEQKRAYSINELASNGPEGRTTLFKAIRERRLVARKAGRKTIVLAEDYEAYLRSLPVIGRHEGST